MTIPTEPIGSIPRPLKLIEAIATRGVSALLLETLFDDASRDTIERFEATGSPVIAGDRRRRAKKISQLLDVQRAGVAQCGRGRL